jgi:hypothetical protein
MTTYLDTVERAEGEVNKLLQDEKVVEEKFGKKAEMKILSVANAPLEVAEELKKLAEANGIFLMLGKELVQEA